MSFKDNAEFIKGCEKAGIPPTAAQFSKFRRHFGAAFAALNAKDGSSGLFDMNGKFIGRIHETPGLEFSDQRATGNIVPQEYGPYSKTPREWPKPKKRANGPTPLALLAAAALVLASRLAKKGEVKGET